MQLSADGLRRRRYYADGAGELVGQHIRKYTRDNKSTRTTKNIDNIYCSTYNVED